METSASRARFGIQRQAHQVVEVDRQVVDLQALGQGSLLGIESGRAAFQHGNIQGVAALHVLQTLLEFHFTGGHLLCRSLLLELRNEDSEI